MSYPNRQFYILNVFVHVLGMGWNPKFFYAIGGKLYSTLICFLLFSASSYGIYARFTYGFLSQSLRNDVVTLATTFITLGNNLTITLILTIFKDRIHRDLTVKIDDYHPIFSDYFKDPGRCTRILPIITAVHLLYLLSIIGDVLNCLPNLFDNFLRYRQSIFTIYYYYFIKGILWKMKRLNRILKTINASGSKRGNVNRRMVTYLQGIYETYLQFSEIVDGSNEVYGWIILVAMLQFFFVYLGVVNSILSLLGSENDVDWSVVADIILYFIYATVRGF